MQTEEPSFLVSLIPLLLIAAVVVIFAYLIARRKRVNVWLWVFLAFLPFVNYFALLLLASKPDRDILERLEALEAQGQIR